VSGARPEGPSKTQRKREADAMQALGEELAGLPAEVLQGLGLPERLQQALEELRHITAHEARRRQRQFIGRLMREVDPAPLQAFIDARQRPTREAARLFRATERWRDRLLAEGEPALRALLEDYPTADKEALAETLAAAQQGRSGAPRRLFRMLKEIVDQGVAQEPPPRGPALLE